jgi:hypothetical protein
MSCLYRTFRDAFALASTKGMRFGILVAASAKLALFY